MPTSLLYQYVNSTSSITTWYYWSPPAATTIFPYPQGLYATQTCQYANLLAATTNLITLPQFPPIIEVDSFRPLPRPAIIRARDPPVEIMRLDAAANRDARQRARDLLVSFLNPEQRAQLEHNNSFVVHTRRHSYRITRGRIANIDVLDKSGLAKHSLCIHPEDPNLPIEDVMLSQLLHLHSDERRLLATANRHPVQRRAA